MAKEIFLEQKKVIRAACYREQKFQDLPQDDLMMKAYKLKMRQCEFGFMEIKPQCKNCVWFQLQEVTDQRGKPLVTDRKLERVELSALTQEYRAQNEVVDLQEAQAIKQLARQPKEG